jgi:hypothetical protein
MVLAHGHHAASLALLLSPREYLFCGFEIRLNGFLGHFHSRDYVMLAARSIDIRDGDFPRQQKPKQYRDALWNCPLVQRPSAGGARVGADKPCRPKLRELEAVQGSSELVGGHTKTAPSAS